MSAPRPLDASSAAILTLCCAIWVGGLVMVKIANTGLSPIINAGLRSICAALVLFVWSQLRGVKLFERDGTLLWGILAGTLFALEFLTLYVGLSHTTAARGVVFLHCAPFVAAAGEHFLVPGHRLSGVRLLGLAAAFAGLAVGLSEALGTGAAAATLHGDLLCLAGGIFWGLITVVAKATPFGRAKAERAVLYQLTVSVPLLLTAAPLLETVRFEWSPTVLGAFAYTVLLVVAFGYTIWFWLMRHTSAASLHAFTFLTPIFGVVAGALILGERVGSPTIAGLVLVAVGIYLVNRTQAPTSPPDHKG